MSEQNKKPTDQEIDSILKELRQKRKVRETVNGETAAKAYTTAEGAERLGAPVAEKVETAAETVVEPKKETGQEKQGEAESVAEVNKVPATQEAEQIVLAEVAREDLKEVTPEQAGAVEQDEYEQDPIYKIFDQVKKNRKAALESETAPEKAAEPEILIAPEMQAEKEELPETEKVAMLETVQDKTIEMTALQREEIPFHTEGEGLEEEDSFTDTAEFKLDFEKAKQTSRVINLESKIDDDFRNFFSETVAVTRTEVEDGVSKTKKQKTEVFAQIIEQEVNGESESVQEEPEEVVESIEYNSIEDTPAVYNELKTLQSSLLVRMGITGVIAALTFYTGLAAAMNLPFPVFLLPSVSSFNYLIWNSVLLIISALVSSSTILGGLMGIFGKATADSLTALAALGSLIQSIYFLVSGTPIDGVITLFLPIAALSLFFNAVGKYLTAGSIIANFDELSQSNEKYTAYKLQDQELAYKLADGLGETEPTLLVSRPTGFTKGFLENSFSDRASDKTAKMAAMIVAVIAVACGGISFYLTKEVANAVSCIAAVTVLGGAFSATLVSAVPIGLMQRAAVRIGAIIPGWAAMEEIKRVNVVTVNDKDLFPDGTVFLHGIKTFEKERIDLAILYAASVLVEGSPTLRSIFLNVIENKTNILYPVENMQYETGCGFTAWIENNRVIIGNREMMRRHDIEIPSLDYEDKFTQKGERQPIYLSVSGKLFGMFVVSYHAEDDVAETLLDLEKSGIAVAVTGHDFCLTSELVSEVYGIPESYIKVFSSEEQEELKPYTNYLPEAEGAMTHLGSFTSFIGGLKAALAGYSAEKLASTVQLAGILLAMFFAVLFTVTSGLARLSLMAVIVYMGAWTILSLLGTLLKKY